MKSAKRFVKKDSPHVEPSDDQISPEERIAKSNGLKVWEHDLWRIMEHLESAMKRQDDYAWVWKAYGMQYVSPDELEWFWSAKQKEHADELGRFIAKELLQRNYQVLRIAAEGWENLHSGKPFKNRAGKPMNKNCVCEAWIALVFRETFWPSLDEILLELANQDPPVKMSKPQLSKVIQDLDLSEKVRDMRSAKNRPKRTK
jgi:hypothetical protein